MKPAKKANPTSARGGPDGLEAAILAASAAAAGKPKPTRPAETTYITRPGKFVQWAQKEKGKVVLYVRRKPH